ncbi:hypothetical protein NDU88_002246 [Pleurodeles waltl]|uniref:Uncharacterized protein n=1 Tax=Pleurodeles waltl TaxID=8319 RepID=A0AAV7UV06_PLEWA|nr:hypothetical protein NDU88_002246 [Pleurodeles waltl]
MACGVWCDHADMIHTGERIRNTRRSLASTSNASEGPERQEAPEGATRPGRLSGAEPGSRRHLRARAGLDYHRRSTHWAGCGEGRDRAGGVQERAAAELCAASGSIGGPRDWALVTGGAAGGDRRKGTHNKEAEVAVNKLSPRGARSNANEDWPGRDIQEQQLR